MPDLLHVTKSWLAIGGPMWKLFGRPQQDACEEDFVSPVHREPLEGSFALSTRNLSVAMGGQAILRDVSLSFVKGKITAILGRSGAGKTTLIRALNGLVQPKEGEVRLGEAGSLAAAANLRLARQHMASVFQDHALIARLSALDNVLLGLAERRHPLSLAPWPQEAGFSAAQALHRVGLLHKAASLVRHLSGGERQRIGIARALVRQPTILLADEPFSSVDPALSRQLIGDFRQLVRQQGMTAIVVLHQMPLARDLADHVIALDNGSVVFDAPVEAFDKAAEARLFPPSSPLQTSTH